MVIIVWNWNHENDKSFQADPLIYFISNHALIAQSILSGHLLHGRISQRKRALFGFGPVDSQYQLQHCYLPPYD